MIKRKPPVINDFDKLENREPLKGENIGSKMKREPLVVMKNT